MAMNKLGKFFTPWTVPRDVWQTALHPDVSGIAVDVQLVGMDHGHCWWDGTGRDGPWPLRN